MAAESMDLRLICPEICGAEAAWAGGSVIAARSLIAVINHFTGREAIGAPKAGLLAEPPPGPGLRDVKGQEGAKRVLEIAAAGGHNLLFCGPPGSGKSMLAQRLPGLLPPLSARELLEVSQIQSISGLLERGRLSRTWPFRAPHHSASMAALVGGGIKAKPRGKCRWPIMASCSWMSCRNSRRMCWTVCVSRWKPGRPWWPGPTGMCGIRRASS
jgi:magnesium chelatase family protein